MRAQLAGTTIHRKIRVGATILLALLLVLEVRKRGYENVSPRKAVGTAEAMLRSRHDLGVVETARYVLCETRLRRTAG